jgi:hypothetical protein
MTLGLCFYILMLLWLVLGFFVAPSGASFSYYTPNLLLFVLFLLLGWKTFGPPLHGG